MISPATGRRCPPHLFSALIACALPIAILGGGRLVAVYLEEKTIHATAPKDFFLKNQGLAFQRAAARAPDILLLYGSSELIDPVPNRASDFFSSAPSGFQVCPVGKAGTNSLIILQKLGALGSKLRHRKVVISLSPSSFLTPAVSPYSYAGNFSLPAASGVLFSGALDLELKAKIVKRMSQFPDTLAKSALLQLAATCLASGRPLDRVVLMAIWPLGKLQNTVLDLQDHFETLVYILGEGKTIPGHRSRPSNSRKAPAYDGQEAVVPESFGAIRSARDAAFRARIAAASEWIDLDLLFRTLTELGARPLILSMPVDGALYDTTGVSRSARQVYYDRMSKLTQQYHFPLIQFEDHDADPTFLSAHREHPSPKGWTYYDRALEDFFHKTN
ncbi:MAG: D-alanyl-lipoteichoic acid biosynthesis protein DltD [Chthoniobacterales bacterium]